MELIGHGHSRLGSDAAIAPRVRQPVPRRLLDWLRVRFQHRWLDGQLAAGADPARDPVFARRAGELTSRRMRNRLAESLERLTSAAEAPPVGLSAAAPIRREAIQTARPELLALAAELATEAPVHPRGVAIVMRLLTDGASPFYSGTASVVEAAAAAHAALIRPWI